MSQINIEQPHGKTLEQARSIAEKLAGKLAERFNVKTEWNDQTLNFSGSGIEGKIELKPETIKFDAELGFLLSALKSKIEPEIRRVLKEKFS